MFDATIFQVAYTVYEAQPTHLYRIEQYCCPGYVGNPPSTSCARKSILTLGKNCCEYFKMQPTAPRLVRMEVPVYLQMNVLALMSGLENTVKYVCSGLIKILHECHSYRQTSRSAFLLC